MRELLSEVKFEFDVAISTPFWGWWRCHAMRNLSSRLFPVGLCGCRAIRVALVATMYWALVMRIYWRSERARTENSGTKFTMDCLLEVAFKLATLLETSCPPGFFCRSDDEVADNAKRKNIRQLALFLLHPFLCFIFNEDLNHI